MAEHEHAASDLLLLPVPARRTSRPVAAAAERPLAHRRIETLVIVLFWLLISEGALRKWVAPQLSQALFFIRDPVLLLIYWYALRGGVLRHSPLLLHIGLAFAVLALPLALVQIAAVGNSQLVTVAIYGWRQYFLYLPLPFIMAASLDRDSVRRFAPHVCAAVILSAPLVFLQFHASPGSVINRGIAEDERLQFQSFAYTGGLIRPSGTFTSTVGITELVSSGFALLLALWLTPARTRGVPLALLLLGSAAVAACLALSGSRAAFVHCAIVMLCALLLGVLTRDTTVRIRALFLPATFLLLLVVLYPIVFPEALSAMLTRVREAYGAESQFSSLGIFGRALYETTDFVDFMTKAPLTGYGLGLGGNGRTWFTSADSDFLLRIAAESDWSRHIVDLGPVVGVLFILYRIAFVFVLFVQVVRATRVSGSALPLLLFGYVGIGLFYGQLTGHGTVGGFLWLFLGLCMASCNISAAGAPRTSAAPTRPRANFIA